MSEFRDTIIDSVRDPDQLIVVDSRHVRAWRMTIFKNGWLVETWWDMDGKTWVTEIRDKKRRLRDQADLSIVKLGSDSRYEEWRCARNVSLAKKHHEKAIALVIKNGDFQ